MSKYEGKTMSCDEMTRFIKRVGRSELFEELRSLQTRLDIISCLNQSYYAKAVYATLDALGYDNDWINDVFNPAFKTYYVTQFCAEH